MLNEKDFKKLKNDLDAAYKECMECRGKAFFIQEKTYKNYIDLSKQYRSECAARLDASNLKETNPDLYEMLKDLTVFGR